MSKKAIFGVIFTLCLACGGLNFSSVSALDDTNSDVAGSTLITNLITQHGGEGGEDGRMCLMDGDLGIPCPTECFDENGEFQACVYNQATGTYRFYQDILEEGTSGEPLVVCADESEVDCDTENTDPEVVNEDGTEEEIEPELWPLILSLSALGATAVFVIIINLVGRKK